MIQFFQSAPFEYCVLEDGVEVARGRLCVAEGQIEIEILQADGQMHDFLFRSMLNVCASRNGFMVYSRLDGEYLKQFGFRLDGVRYAVLAEDIRFPGCGNH